MDEGLQDWLLASVLVLVLATPLIGLLVVKRLARRFDPTRGVIADAFADQNQQFALEVAAGGAVDLYVHYTIRGSNAGRGNLRWALTVLVEVSREPGHTERYEYVLGSSSAPRFGEAPEGNVVASGPVLKSGAEITRGALLTRVPAGGRLSARGKVKVGAACELQSFLFFAKAG